MASSVAEAPAQRPALYSPAKERWEWSPEKPALGLHPMASQPCRRWELEKWSAVAQALLTQGKDVFVFGSPGEAAELNRHFGHLQTSGCRIVTGNLQGYFELVSQMQLLVCPDSFAAHVAYALGVPTIMLNGANDAEAWAPPGAVVLAAGPELSCYPCYNRPTCVGSDHEFGCVRRIGIAPVLDAVAAVLQQTFTSTLPVLQ